MQKDDELLKIKRFDKEFAKAQEYIDYMEEIISEKKNGNDLSHKENGTYYSNNEIKEYIKKIHDITIKKQLSSAYSRYTKLINFKVPQMNSKKTKTINTKHNNEADNELIEFSKPENYDLQSQARFNSEFASAQEYIRYMNKAIEKRRTKETAGSSLSKEEMVLRNEAKKFLSLIHFKPINKAFNQAYSKYMRITKVFQKRDSELDVQQVSKKTSKKKKKMKQIMQAEIIDSGIQRRVESYEKYKEEQIKERIRQRKGQEKQKHIEPDILVEAYLEDFSSKRSRANIQSVNLLSIKSPFKKATINFLNEDGSVAHKVCFEFLKETISFAINFGEKIKINRSKSLLLEQDDFLSIKTSEKNIILDTLATLLYIGHATNLDSEDTCNTVLQIKDKNSIAHYIGNADHNNTIRIDFKQRGNSIPYSHENTTKRDKRIFVRGHWRKQKYKNHIKLIWINPFWKGAQKSDMPELNEQRYKVLIG